MSKEYKFGFTDTSIFLAAKNSNAAILTGERLLWSYCQNLGIGAHHLDDILVNKGVIQIRPMTAFEKSEKQVADSLLGAKGVL